jgi:CRP/FNR family cyclic AMP-dependent transcriptional regulator
MPAYVDTPSLIAKLPDPALRDLAARGSVRAYRKDVVIIQERDVGDSLFIILAGRVKVYTSGEDAREFVIGTHGAGQYVGEMSLDGRPRSASIMTLEPTICSVVTRTTLREHIAKHPEFAFDVLAKVIERARRATESAAAMALQPVYGRLVRLMNELAVERNGERVLLERLTHQEIADRIGSSREMVSRLLTDLTRGGYVAIVEKHLVLRKPLPPAW